MSARVTFSKAEVIARLERGDSLESIALEVAGPARAELLKRCATVRHFDRDLFDEVLAGDFDGDFDELVDEYTFLPIPGSSGQFRLERQTQRDHFSLWWEKQPGRRIPHSLGAFAKTLIERYEASGDRLEMLHQLVLVDISHAARLFHELFDEADRSFDLARCQDVIDCLDDELRIQLLSPKLAGELDDREVYLRTRSAWSYDWFRTARFLEPEGLRERFDDLIEGRSAPVVQVHGPGGSGKTMQLRWVISRFLLPEPRRVACARVDFDVIDPVAGTTSVWLVLLELARQLNPQLAHKPFSELLASYERFLPVIGREMTTRKAQLTAALASDELGSRLATELPMRIRQTIKETASSRPILLVFDTLEEVSLQMDVALGRLVAELAILQEQCPNIRMVLSGRYDLEERLKSLPETFPGIETYSVEAFSPSESTRYLTEKRGLSNGEIVDVIVDRVKGSPFKLAMAADMLESGVEISAKELSAFNQIELVYLTERVIRRLEDRRVRWLVRYGVIRRTLTFEFLRDVLRTPLARAMAGDPAYDNPEDDPLPEGLVQKDQPLFPTGIVHEEITDQDLEGLWRKLESYAGGSSWIMVEHGPGGGLTFHPDVRQPMLRMLSRQSVFRTLHREASDYYGSMASEDPDQWPMWMQESIAHRFEAEGSLAGAYWAEQMAAAEQTKKPEWREAIAQSILTREFIADDGSVVLAPDGKPVINPRLVTQARFHLSSALADRADKEHVGPGHTWWTSAAALLQRYVRAVYLEGSVDPVDLALLKAKVLRGQRNYSEAAGVLRGALDELGDAPELKGQRWLLRLGYAGALRWKEDHEEIIAVLQANVSEGSRGVPDGSVVETYYRLAQVLAERDRIDEALEACRKAIVKTQGDSLLQLRAFLADLWLRAGCPYRALHEFKTTGADPSPATAALSNRIEHARLADDNVIGDLQDDAEVTLSAFVSFVRFRYLDRAEDIHERGLESFSSAGRITELVQLIVEFARMQLRVVGNLKAVPGLLDQAGRFGAETEQWLAVQLLRAEYNTRALQPMDIIFENAVHRLESEDAPPRLFVRLAIAGLAHHRAESARYVEMLIHHLVRVQPVTARLSLLRDLDMVESYGKTVPQLDQLEELIDLGRRRVDARDRALLSLPQAEVHRLRGDISVAASKLTKSLPVLEEESHLAVAEWARAYTRLAGQATLFPTQLNRNLRILAQFPMLCDEIVLDAARAHFLSGEMERALSLARREPKVRKGALGSSRLEAARLELLAEIGWARGDDEHLVGQLSSRAAGEFDELGDPVSARRVLGLLKEADAVSAPESDNRALRLVIEQVDEKLKAIVVRRATPDLSFDLPDELDRATQSGSALELIPGGSMDLLRHNPAAASKGLAGLLHDNGVLPSGGPPPKVGVVVEITNPSIQHLPWELGWSTEFRLSVSRKSIGPTESEVNRYLQAALGAVLARRITVDGRFGPASRDALKAFQAGEGLRADGVPGVDTRARLRQALRRASLSAGQGIILISSLYVQRRSLRGPSLYQVDVPALYMNHDFQVLTDEEPTVRSVEGAIGSWIRTTEPWILQISCGLREERGAVHLDFAGGYSRSKMSARGSEPFTTTQLDRLLRTAGKPAVKPVVILDIARPPGASETARALMLRNLFAAEFFSLGATSAVIATGLSAPFEGERLYDLLLGTLADGGSLEQAVDAVRDVPTPGSFEEPIGRAATVLFTNDPEMSVTPFRVLEPEI